jgi:NADH-quinone oxidoreductase subunit D
MHANYFRVGGVHQDLPPKLLDDIWAFCDPFLQVCDDLEVLLTENRIFKQRNVGIAEVKLADAWGWGFSGVMVRASGAAWDLRKARPMNAIPKWISIFRSARTAIATTAIVSAWKRCGSRSAS